MTQSKLNKLSSVIHFIGIGGIGMSGIAEVMHNSGYNIQGSDLAENFNTARLKALGVKIFTGHSPDYIENADYVVISSDVKKDNIEVVAATVKAIPIIRRAEMLAELLRFKTAIAISGSHGKTTTTSLTACMLEAAGLSPTVINGGIINNKSTNAYLGTGEYVVAEADESDGTFIKIPATVGVITNIDPEHLNYYGNFENLIAAFKQFILNLPFYGFAVACVDHPTVRSLISTITERKIITYGIESEDAHVRAFNIRTSGFSSIYDVKIELPRSGGSLTIENIILATPGLHNVMNSLSAIAIAAEMDFGSQVIRNAFKNFKGVKRRFTKLCEYNGVSVIDDYAHHPAEVKATLATACDVVKNNSGKVIAIFQPHRYSRLSTLFQDFVDCFGDADELHIMNVFAAGEQPIEGYDSSSLVKAIETKYPKFKVSYLDNTNNLEKIALGANAKDIVLMMGAGNITYLAAELAEKLNRQTKIVA